MDRSTAENLFRDRASQSADDSLDTESEEKSVPSRVAIYEFLLTQRPTRDVLFNVLKESIDMGAPDHAQVAVVAAGAKPGGSVASLLAALGVPLYKITFSWLIGADGEPLPPPSADGGTEVPGGRNTDH